MSKYQVVYNERGIFCYYPPSLCRVYRGGSLLAEQPAEFEDTSKPLISSSFDDDEQPYLLKLGERIDYYKPFPFEPYITQSTSSNHVVLFYQSREGHVGYREITDKRTGPFHRFLNTKDGVLHDASFLATYDELHVLMVVRTPFSHQLIYRKKTEDVFTPPVSLWESPKIDNCLLTLVGEELHATCMISGKLHRSISYDEGDTFGSVELYKRKFCAEPVKADFISEMPTDGWYARQVYVDSNAPWDVQMLPDLVDFFR